VSRGWWRREPEVWLDVLRHARRALQLRQPVRFATVLSCFRQRIRGASR
jgi:hypothetical protein